MKRWRKTITMNIWADGEVEQNGKRMNKIYLKHDII